MLRQPLEGVQKVGPARGLSTLRTEEKSFLAWFSLPPPTQLCLFSAPCLNRV